MLKYIRDSVHGNLELNEFEIGLTDTPEIQRLRRIKQLGFTYLVYPGANHTRFEHSIGTMYLASRLAKNLGLESDELEMVRTVALLHDAGHGPFSHVSEGVLSTPHEQLTSKVMENSQLGDAIKEKYSIKEIMNIIQGKSNLSQIVSGELDVDRMDYLLRDSHYTGVAYGIIDVERLIHNMKLEEHLILDKKGIQAAESTLVARYFMYPSVYQHHTTRIINSMFRRCLRKLLEQGRIREEEIYRYDDLDLIAICRGEEGFVNEIMQRLDNRDLFKSVFSLKLDELEDPEEIFHLNPGQILQSQIDLAADLDLSPDYVFIDIPEYPFFDEMSTLVEVEGDVVKLSQISSIVGALQEARFNHADLCIYLPEEKADEASEMDLKEYIPINW